MPKRECRSAGKERSSGQSSNSADANQRHCKSGKAERHKSSGSKSGKSDQNHQSRGSISKYSAGFRIASVSNQSGKASKKEKASTTSYAKTSFRVDNEAESGRGSADGHRKVVEMASTKLGGSHKIVEMGGAKSNGSHKLSEFGGTKSNGMHKVAVIAGSKFNGIKSAEIAGTKFSGGHKAVEIGGKKSSGCHKIAEVGDIKSNGSHKATEIGGNKTSGCHKIADVGGNKSNGSHKAAEMGGNKSSGCHKIAEVGGNKSNGSHKAAEMGSNKSSGRLKADDMSHSPSQCSSKTSSSLSPFSNLPVPTYKECGSSSEKTLLENKKAENLPDPYIELTNLVNEEIKEIAMRGRPGGTASGQNLPGGTFKFVASPPLSRSTRSGSAGPANKARGVPANFELIQSKSRKSSKDATVSPDPTMNCKSPLGFSGHDRGSGTLAINHSNQRPTSGRRAPGSATDVRDGGRGVSSNVTRSGVGGGGGGGSGGSSQVGSKGKVSPNGKDATSKARGSRNVTATNSEQMEEDDDEDESGMPQAVRLPEPTLGEPETNIEICRRIHKGRMEKIAKSVHPSDLMKHLSDAGYFRHDYSGSARTTSDNTNLKNGMKKGVERLYLWLSMYTPSEENTNWSKSNGDK